MKITVAAVQMAVTDDKAGNLETMKRQVEKCAQSGAKIVALPEMFCCAYRNESFISNREPAGGRVWTELGRAAKENSVYLFGGSMPEDDGGRIYNTCFVFGPDGRQIGRHRKMHLFDINIRGGQAFRESDVFSRGNDVTVVETEYGRVGVMICFDIRFPELAGLLAQQGARMIIVPAAFNATTGPMHWETLFKARALDSQAFALGCAPSKPEKGYQAYGHSILVSPWGRVLSELDYEPGLLMEEIELDEVEEVRAQLPVLSAKRTDVYSLERIK